MSCSRESREKSLKISKEMPVEATEKLSFASMIVQPFLSIGFTDGFLDSAKSVCLTPSLLLCRHRLSMKTSMPPFVVLSELLNTWRTLILSVTVKPSGKVVLIEIVR